MPRKSSRTRRSRINRAISELLESRRLLSLPYVTDFQVFVAEIWEDGQMVGMGGEGENVPFTLDLADDDNHTITGVTIDWNDGTTPEWYGGGAHIEGSHFFDDVTGTLGRGGYLYHR